MHPSCRARRGQSDARGRGKRPERPANAMRNRRGTSDCAIAGTAAAASTKPAAMMESGIVTGARCCCTHAHERSRKAHNTPASKLARQKTSLRQTGPGQLADSYKRAGSRAHISSSAPGARGRAHFTICAWPSCPPGTRAPLTQLRSPRRPSNTRPHPLVRSSGARSRMRQCWTCSRAQPCSGAGKCEPYVKTLLYRVPGTCASTTFAPWTHGVMQCVLRTRQPSSASTENMPSPCLVGQASPNARAAPIT